MTVTDTTFQAHLDSLSEAELDNLEFGVVRMDLDGTVTAYNEAEARLACLSKDRVMGRNFFESVAPCTNNFMVAEKYFQNDELDEHVDYVFTLRMKPTPVRLRLLKSAAAGTQYLIVYRQ